MRRGGCDGCPGCPSCNGPLIEYMDGIRCTDCGAMFKRMGHARASTRSESQFGLTAAPVPVGQLDMMIEDPDDRPYIWDLEE